MIAYEHPVVKDVSYHRGEPLPSRHKTRQSIGCKSSELADLFSQLSPVNLAGYSVLFLRNRETAERHDSRDGSDHAEVEGVRSFFLGVEGFVRSGSSSLGTGED